MNVQKVRYPVGVSRPRNRVGWNSIFVFVSRAMDVVTRIVLVALIARYLGRDLFGEYAFVMAIVFFLLPLSDFGMERIIVREISRDIENADKYMGSFLTLKILISLILIPVIFFITHIFHWDNRIVLAAYIATASQIFVSFRQVFLGIFRAFERMEYDTILTFLHGIFKLVGVLFVIEYDMGFLAIFFALAFADLIKLALQAIVVFLRFVRPYMSINLSLCKGLIKEAYPLGIFALIAMASFKIDVFILNYFKTKADISLFEVPHRIVMQFQIVPVSVVTSLFPVLSRLAVSSKTSLHEAYTKAFKFLFVLGLLFSVSISIWSKEIILIIFGREFLDASLALQFLVWTIAFLFVISLMNFTLTSIGKQRLTTVSVTICFTVNLLLDLLLVPKYGYVGASIGTLIAYISFFCVSFYFINKNVGRVEISSSIIKPVLSGMIMIVISLVLKNSGFPWGLSVFTGIFFYIVSLLVVKTFTEDDIKTLANSFTRKPILTRTPLMEGSDE